jgi:hypothetical protein
VIHLAIIAAVILLVLWLLGMSTFSLGAFAHIFLALAVVALILCFLGGDVGRRYI